MADRTGCSLIPFGMSGLKCLTSQRLVRVILSHPVWDEWIEIFARLKGNLSILSHPVWDEWIEIAI